ncbi:hypothetical protein HPB48_001422 [Haemaphysalis longicornis]|uniref:Dolichyl-phosphate-mannose--protein mannosyltransferase n=1 Tax=Haemaphysalis longicornis TaxID=44386 RepID=A0A9J6GZV3_HAELO|nr:hypothetical protein HPB48_001422 [Haemaphysalis longicornis]
MVVGALSWLCYANALGCGFVFDDASAVRDNRDLRPSTPIGRLFANDFWGTPIHKVTGVVGRAESLSSVFFLLAFLAYTRAADKWKRTEWRPLAACVVLMVVATLCKEQGITVVAVCFVYEIFVIHERRDSKSWEHSCPSSQSECQLVDLLTLGGVPDPRNAATLALYVTLGALAYVALFSSRHRLQLGGEVSAGHDNVIFLSLSLLVFPFLPASNLFFPVGFVVAERILYMPSMGFCLLVAHGWHTLLKNHANSVQPDDIGAHMNVGRTYNNLLRFEEAEAAFWKAKDLLPRPKPGEPYKARIAPNHLNVFLN